MMLMPTPRLPVSLPSLTRPDWTTTVARSEDLLWLDKNENTDPQLAAFTANLLKEINPVALFSYPDNGPLYQKLALFEDISPRHLILSAGSDGLIRYVFEAFVNTGDTVIHTVPTFAMYSVYSAMYGAKVVPLHYQPSSDGPKLGVNEIISTIYQYSPKLVCLPNPDSPTGTVFNEDEMQAIIESAGKVGAVILVDEAYHPFYAKTVVPWVRKYPHLIVARTFAKAWGLAGLRIGYGISSPELTQYLHKVRPMYETNTLAVFYMEKMLDNAEQMRQSVERLNTGKAYFLEEMKKQGFRTLNGHGNFLHVSFGSKAPAIFKALEKTVLFRQDFKESCLSGFTRFSSTTRELFEPIVRRIEGA